jgi:hypothetical protein
MPDDEQSIDDLVGLLSAKPTTPAPKEPAARSAEPKTPIDKSGDEHTPDAEHDDAEGDHGNPDEGTAAEPAEHDEGEAEGEEAEGERSPTEPLYTVKIDGKEKQVTLAEALAGYQRQEDYTRKTQEAAAKTQALETEAQGIRAAREQYQSVLKVLSDQLKQVNEPTADEWNQLRNSDPDTYAVRWADFQRREQQRNAVKAEQDRVANEQREDGVKQLRAHIQTESAKVIEALPEWKDEAKRSAGFKAIREYGAEIGFSEQELNQVYDSRMVRMANDAAQWRAHVARQAKAREKIQNAPEAPAPRNQRSNPKTAKQVERKAAREKFVRTGSVEDAVSLLLK